MRGGYRRFAYRLALRLGHVNVDRMLEQITWSQFQTWCAYDTAEPFGPERDDYRIASVVHALVNLQRDSRKHPQGFPLEDFVLKFGDAVAVKRAKMDAAEMERRLNTWIAGSNLLTEAKERAS